MALRLSLNVNPLVNRFADVDDLCDTVAQRIRAGYIQLNPEFLNPSWPSAVIAKRERQFRAAFARNAMRATSVMTAPVAGLTVSNRAPLSDGTNAPSIQHWLRNWSAAARAFHSAWVNMSVS